MNGPDVLYPAVERAYGRPERTLETLWSRLYFCGETVVKTYKRAKRLGLDLTTKDGRRSFFADDFAWNHSLSPDIYIALKGVQLATGSISNDVEAADDLIIEMKHADTSHTFSDLLENDEVHVEEVKDVVLKLIDGTEKLKPYAHNALHDIAGIGWRSIFEANLGDIPWYFEETARSDNETAKHGVEVCRSILGSSSYMESFPNEGLTAGIDTLTDNILYMDGNARFFDMMYPLRRWRLVDPAHNVARFCMFLRALGGQRGKELSDAAYREYFSRTSQSVPDDVILLYELRNALWQWGYRCARKQSMEAALYAKETHRLINLISRPATSAAAAR